MIVNKKMTKKHIIISLGIIGILACTLLTLEKAGIIDFWHSGTNTKAGPTKEEKAAEDKFNSDAKKKFIEDSSKSNNNEGTATPTVSLSLSAQQESTGSVTLFTKLYGIPSGKCTLTITNGGQKNVQSADILYQSEYSSCEGFSIPVSMLGTGNWNIQLSVNSNGKNYVKDVDFEVK